jgi:hypothetical protein
MPVQRYRATCLNLNKVNGVGIGMDQFREKAGCYFPYINIIKIAKNGGIHVLGFAANIVTTYPKASNLPKQILLPMLIYI